MNKKLTKRLQQYAFIFICSLFLVSCGRGCLQKDAPAPTPQDPIKEIPNYELMPKQLNVVVGMNIHKVLSSPIGSKIQEKIPLIAKPFMDELDEVTFGWEAKQLGKGPETILGLLTGKFDTKKVEERLKQYSEKNQENYLIEEYQNAKLYYFQEKPQETLSILGNKLLLGHKDLVKQAIDLARQDPTSRAQNSILSQVDLMKQVKSIDSKKMLWFAAIVPEQQANADASPNHIKAVDLTIDFPEELNFELGLTAASEADAKDMESQALSYQILFGQRFSQKDPSFAEAVKAIKIESQGNRLSIYFSLTPEQIKSLESLNLGPQ